MEWHYVDIAMEQQDYWRKISQAEQEAPEEESIQPEQVQETRLQVLKRRIASHDLPIRTKLEELENGIEGAMGRSRVFLLLGETGSGKSIYSPLAVRNVLKKLGLPDKIIILQPRKDAAKGVAEAHAAVTDGELGRDVGYSTSETKMVERDTPVRVVTSGILPRYLFSETVDKENTGAIILDEVHEGSLDYHYVFGLLKELREQGKAPFIFLTSATVQKEKFQKFFGFDDQDFMQIEGRTYPVEKQYLVQKLEEPADYFEGRDTRKDYLKETIALVQKAIVSERVGDILVFLPGAPEINEVTEVLSEIKEIEVVALHGGLSFDDRNRALSGEKMEGAKRRVIVATNIAETSVTVPNVTIVVDSCRRRSKRFDTKTGIFRTGTEYISKQEAEQRAGRAGRIEPGECFRVLTEETFQSLPEQTETEIERTSLAHLILRLRGYGRDPETFPFFVEPKKEALHAGVEQLRILGALDESGEITDVGKRMLDMPFRPEDSRMLIEAEDRECSEAAMTLALCAREQKLFTYPTKEEIDQAPGYSPEDKKTYARQAIARAQQPFEQDGSDWAKRLNIFIQAIDEGVFECLGDRKRPEVKQAERNFKEWCKMYHFNPEALRHIAYRLYEFSREAGIDFDRYDFQQRLIHTEPADLNRSILAGYQERLLHREGDGRMPPYGYLQKNHIEVTLSPGSSAFSSTPEFCVVGNIEEGSGTSWGRKIKRNYASLVHPASFEEVLELMGDRLTPEPQERGFDYVSGRAVETVQYFRVSETGYKGEPLGSIKRPVDGKEATQMLASALVNEYELIMDLSGEGWRRSIPFHEKNLSILKRLKDLSVRSQGRVVVPNLVSWYEERLGNTASLDDAIKLGDFLVLDSEKYCSSELLKEIDRDFPEFIEIGGTKKRLYYITSQEGRASGAQGSLQVTTDLSPEEVANLEEATVLEVGPSDNRIPLTIVMNLEGHMYRSESLMQLKKIIGNPELSYSLQMEYRNTKRILDAMLNDMQSKRTESTKLGFTVEEFQTMIENIQWCLGILASEVEDEAQGKEKIQSVRETISRVKKQFEEKKLVVAERRKERMVEAQALYKQEENWILAVADSTDPNTSFEIRRDLGRVRMYAFGESYGYNSPDIADPDEALVLLAKLLKKVRDMGAHKKGALAAALARAKGEEAGTGEKGEQDVSQKDVKATRMKKEKVKVTVEETEMTPEIREDMRSEIGYWEVVLEDMIEKAMLIVAGATSKIKSKAEEAAERVLKRKELRRELKDLFKEVESNEKPTVVHGHIKKVCDSVYSLLKTNLYQMIPGYDKDWVEVFRYFWDQVPERIASDKEIQEYIVAGVVTQETLCQDVRILLKPYMLAMQKGEQVNLSLEDLIEEALGKY